MRILILLLVVAAAGGAAYFLLDTDANEQAPGDDPTADEPRREEERPELSGSGDGSAADAPSAALTGTGEIVGVVQIGGNPAPARVELRLVSQVELSVPGAGMAGIMKSWIDRILDAGMATGPADDTYEADADGAFRFRRLTAGFYEVRAIDDDGRQGVVTASLPAQGARVAVTVELPAGDITLKGRVVRADEKPFHGWVVVQPAAQSSGPFMVATGATAPVDADGRFEVAGLMAGDVIISAFQPGELRAMGAPVRLPYDGEYTLTIGAAGGTIHGKVIAQDTAEPIEGAMVIGGRGDPRSGLTIRSATTGPDGRFSLAVGAGNGGMFVRADGYVAPPVQLRSGSEDEVVVTMTPVAHIKGRVLTKAGAPVGGIAVMAVPADMGRGGFATVSATTADADGNFELTDVNPLSGTATVFALGKGFASPGMQNLDEPAGALVVTVEAGKTLEHDVEVVEAGRVSGRVDAGGKPIAGAIVTVVAESQGGLVVRQFGFGEDAGFGSAVTDGEGQYVLDSIVPDASFQLVVRAVDHPTKRSDAFKLAGGSKHTLDITLETARWLELEVVSSEGEAPVAGAVVVAGTRETDEGSWVRINQVFNTGPDGRVRAGPLPKGRVAVQIEAGGHVKARDWQEIEGGDDGDLEGRVVLAKGLEMAGTVLPPEGAPANAVEVTVQSVNFRGGNWVWERASVKEDGSFVVDVLPEGTFQVSAELDWQGAKWRAEEKLAAGTVNAKLVLEKVTSGAGSYVVKVVDPDGNPVPSGSFVVHQRYQNGSGTHSSSFSNGTFDFEVGQPGTVIFIEIYRVPGSNVAATLAGPFDTSKNELEIKLGTPTTIEGVVRDASGAPVGGARISAKPMLRHGDEIDFGNAHASAATDKDGRYVLKGVGESDYRVEARVPDAYQPPEPIDTVGGTKRVDFVLKAGVTAAITVLDHRGDPVKGASVSIRSHQESEEASIRNDGMIAPHSVGGMHSTGADGIVRLKALDGSSRYDVTVSNVEAKSLLPRAVRGWTPADTTIELEQAFTISGVIRDASGSPVEGARAYYIVRTDTKQSEPTGKDGKFVIQGLRKGSGRLLARVDAQWIDVNKDYPDEIKGDAGATGVTLTVDPGLAIRIRIKDWTGERWAHATLTAPENRLHLWKQIDEDGRVVFQGLKSDERYTLRISGLPDDKYVFLKDLEAGGGERVVTPKKGKTIRGRLELPTGLEADTFAVVIQGEFNIWGAVMPDGTFELKGVPDGTWTIRAQSSGNRLVEGGGTYQGQARARAGDEDVVIEVKRKE